MNAQRSNKEIKKNNRLRTGIAIVLAIPVLSPLLFLSGNDYLTQIVTRILIYGILVLSVEMCWGQTGIFTFGQAALFGIGGYTVGLITTKTTITNLFIALSFAIVVGALISILIGFFLFSGKRVGELYVALVTLALSYICERLANSWTFLGSGNGIPGIPFPTILGKEINSNIGLFFMVYSFFAFTLIICVILVNSQFGLTMNAVRDDEERAEFFGYRRNKVQILVFTFSAVLASLAGGLFALSEGLVSPSMSGLALSTTTVLWVVLGGRGTFFGPLIALALLQAVNIQLQNILPSLWTILLGIILLLTMLFLPKGLSSIPSLYRQRKSERSAK
ncbi:MAG: branched-chain amino acid ABC transporter permease [Actinobacteria bacterium]|nr:branched-chain amino acid ABC transporter permease [Actinomycetota bacterium]